MSEGLPVIAQRLRQARTKAGISQEKLGVLAGIDEFSASARVNQYERGKHTPDFLTMEHFARVLGVPTAYFYARDEETAQLLEVWGKLPQEERQAVITQMAELLKSVVAVER